MGKTSIEWSEMSWNPVRGCTKVTPGCAKCYASTFAERFRGVPGHPYEQGFDLRLVPDKLTEPLRWRNPRTVFVNSMSDLFQGKVPDSYIDRVFETMRLADWHTYQVLTKRAKRMRRWSETRHPTHSGTLRPLPNVWLGVSVEDRKHGLPRIEELRETPAAVRFLSIEPLLEDLGTIDLRGIHWVIVGGESGPGARPMHPWWVRDLQRQCEEAEVHFFFKQWGAWMPALGTMMRVGKKKAGRQYQGRTWDAMPPIERAEYPGRREVVRRRLVLSGALGAATELAANNKPSQRDIPFGPEGDVWS